MEKMEKFLSCRNTFAMFATQVTDYDYISQAERIRARGGTDTGAPVRKLTKEGRKVDQIIMITDEQQNGGSPFYEELRRYRMKVNAEAKAFIVDISPYRHAMVPPADPQTFYIYGWSDTILSYIAQSVKGYATMIGRIEGIQLEEEGST